MYKFLLIALTSNLALWGCSTKSPVQTTQGSNLPQGVATIYPGQGFRFADAKVVWDSIGYISDVLVYVPQNQNGVFLGDSVGYIADLGAVTLESVTAAPDSDYWGILPAVKHHTYCVKARGGKYAKLYLNDVMRNYPSGSITFQWVYQPSGGKTF
jgi:hypothetical protein